MKKAAEDTKKEDPKKSMKPAAASTTKDKDPKKAEKKEDAKPSGPHPSQLDIRVGKVLSVNRHPDAESLYVEEVDLGEPTPRTVVSGLVKFMPPESIKDHLIVLLCNLKPAKMRGVESQAMVLTAESQDGVKVELLAPPAGSKPGDKVYFEGFGKGTPEAVLTPKKKIWEGIQVALKTDDNCRPVFCGADGKACALMTEKGECRAKTIKGGRIK